MIRDCFLVVLSGALFASSAIGQIPNQSAEASQPTFTSRTNLVLVPVVVTDKKNSHVAGLKREDFELEAGGKVQKIAVFEEQRATSTPFAPNKITQPNVFTNDVSSVSSGTRPKVLEIIVLDLLNTRFENQVQAKQALIKFLAGSGASNALLALVVMGQNGPKLIHDFTDRPGVLMAALRQIDPRLPPLSTPASPDGAVSDDAQAIATEAGNLNAVLSGTAGSVADQAEARAREAVRSADNTALRSLENNTGLMTLSTLQFLAQHYASVPGRKSLIWATGGFPFLVDISSPGEVRGGLSLGMYQQTFRILAAANIAVYPLDVRGVIPGVFAPSVSSVTSLPPSSIPSRSSALQSISLGNREVDPTMTMRAIAEMTGGHSYNNNNDILEMFQRAASDSTSYYMLGYYLDKDEKPSWKKLQVKVNHPGVRVSHRSGFFATRNEDVTGSRQSDERMALSSPLEYTGLTITVVWQGMEAAATKKKLNFTVAIAKGDTQIDTQHGNHVSLDFIAIARDEKGNTVAQRSQSVDRDLPPDAARHIENNGLDYRGALELPSGEYSVRVVVRDNLSGRMGSLLAPLKVN